MGKLREEPGSDIFHAYLMEKWPEIEELLADTTRNLAASIVSERSSGPAGAEISSGELWSQIFQQNLEHYTEIMTDLAVTFISWWLELADLEWSTEEWRWRPLFYDTDIYPQLEGDEYETDLMLQHFGLSFIEYLSFYLDDDDWGLPADFDVTLMAEDLEFFYAICWHATAHWLTSNQDRWKGIDPQNIPGLSDQIIKEIFKRLNQDFQNN